MELVVHDPGGFVLFSLAVLVTIIVAVLPMQQQMDLLFVSATALGWGLQWPVLSWGREDPWQWGEGGQCLPDSPFTSAMFRPLPMLFFMLLMRLERKAESTSECRDALEMLMPVKLWWGKVSVGGKITRSGSKEIYLIFFLTTNTL